jgi:hypothetical protein
MKRNRNIIITGSGAVIPWGANTTAELTDILKFDTKFINDRGERIGQYLYDLLKQNPRSRNEPNFETILNFIEAIYQFKSSKRKLLSEKYSLRSSFQIADYCHIDKDINSKLLSFEEKNPKIRKELFDPVFLLDTAVNQDRKVHGFLFYMELYLHFVFLIVERIKVYDNKSNIDNYSKLNERFNRFLLQLNHNRGLIRYYTLNYDLFPLKIYDGFSNGYNNIGELDIKGIINGNFTDVYYNLHGSINIDLRKIKAGYVYGFDTATTFENNKLIPSPIITGYNKLDRLFEMSYFHLYNKLIDDCYNADNIYIIGYSFGDKHINSAIRGAMQIGKTRITIIDRIDINDKDSRIRFTNNYKRTSPTPDYSIAKMEPINTRKLQLHFNGFEEYLGNI